MTLNTSGLKWEFFGTFYGTTKYGLTKGPYLRQPFWRSFTDFENLKLCLEKKYQSKLTDFPVNRCPLLKFRWSRDQTMKRCEELVKFLNQCLTLPNIWQNRNWRQFLNPLELDTSLYQELNYRVISLIEHSQNSDVYRIESDIDRKQYALKAINLQSNLTPLIKNEIDIHRKINHVHCLKFYGYFLSDCRCMLILEVANRSVLDVIENKYPQGIPENIAQKWFYQFILALLYLSHNNIVHRDLKPQNLLIMRNGTIKLCDYGFANHQEREGYLFASCGTKYYAAPEITSGKPYDGFSSDIYSAGMVLFSMLAGEKPIARATIASFSDPARDLLTQMVVIMPIDRISLLEILQHPWLSDYYQLLDIHTILTQPKINIHLHEYSDIIWKTFPPPKQDIIERTIERIDNDTEIHIANTSSPK